MKDKSSKTNPVKRYSWRTLIGVVSGTLLLVGVVSAVSMKNEPTVLKAQVAGRSSDMSKESGQNRHYVTTNASGQTVVLDRQTGETRPMSPQEAQMLAEGIKQLINQSTDGLVQVRHANGAVSMDLQGRFQNVSVAKREDDGTITQSCVNDLESAANFFEIDPALVGVAVDGSKAQPSYEKWPVR